MQISGDSIHEQNKAHIKALRAALYDIQADALAGQLRAIFAPDAAVHLAHPLEDLNGPDDLYERAYQPLLHAMPDLERRDFIVMAGGDDQQQWVGCAGHYLGSFERHWLGIPPTQQPVAMRYHEFFRMEAGRVAEMQALWDIPQVMMQASAWPLSPSLGVEWVAPGPATQDGIISTPYDEQRAAASLHLVDAMLRDLQNSVISADAMNLDKYWHPQMLWYGPAGIGSGRQVRGFRQMHQIPFLNAMPDRRAFVDTGVLFADGDYVGFTAWPGMQMTVSGDGWLGIAPANQQITMRSLDFWRCEHGLIRENWVLVDLLHVYHQIGVDVLARMREYTHARQPR